ncbi:hypothetical protein C0991_002632, partial [Blastosporella zonata]
MQHLPALVPRCVLWRPAGRGPRRVEVLAVRSQRQGPADILATPAATDGETATETELETEVDIDDAAPHTEKQTKKLSKHQAKPSIASSISSGGGNIHGYRRKAASQHDLLNKYFTRDTV